MLSLRTGASTAVAALAGAVGWTVTEYVLHRFAMHEMKGRGLASREHLHHHADVTYFSPTSKKLISAAGTTSVVLPLAWVMAGRRRALAFTGGLIAMYFGYELVHRRTHTHPPVNEYGRRVRKSHLYHHFGGPRRNYGVTTDVWDRVMGTFDDPGIVTVPPRMAPAWLLDDQGEVWPEFAWDYETRGRLRSDTQQDEQDRLDAFANRAPRS